MYDQGQEIKQLHAGAEQLKTNCENLEQLRDQFKKEAEWMLRQNNKLKGKNTCCDPCGLFLACIFIL